MNGYAIICHRLLVVGIKLSVLDKDNYTALMYALLRGNTECVRVLLEEGHADLSPPAVASDLIPLSLACRVGNIDVVKLLLEYKATSVPNTNGEYPIHIAAQEGHSEICRLLVNYDGWDTADKYNEWTPLFHAARNGHASCVKVLLELGSRVGVTDETGKQAVFYAAWYGHPKCVALLLDAAHQSNSSGIRTRISPYISPAAGEIDASADDTDMIPSLSLPPPIMPYRVYGHNFLDKAALVHVSVGHPFSNVSAKTSAVNLSSRLVGGSANALLPNVSPLFKLVMTCKPDITSAPYSVSIPVRDERDFFIFQAPDLDEMSLEFSIYPNFGTKTIGRAVALASMLRNPHSGSAYVLPILDHHLVVIGQVSFEVRVITPFKGVTLEIGGAVETYWKSLALPFSIPSRKPAPRIAQPFKYLTTNSAQTSPSTYSVSGSGGHTITLSSLSGDYVHLVVQVTRDHQPIVYDKWKLPVPEFDIAVSDATLAQVQALSGKTGHSLDLRKFQNSSPAEWYKHLSGSMLPLRHLMKVCRNTLISTYFIYDPLQVLPPSLGIYLDLAFAPNAVRKKMNVEHGHLHNLNHFVDAILRAVYSNSALQSRRRLIFGSFCPDICAAVNWKQPNCE